MLPAQLQLLPPAVVSAARLQLPPAGPPAQLLLAPQILSAGVAYVLAELIDVSARDCEGGITETMIEVHSAFSLQSIGIRFVVLKL